MASVQTVVRELIERNPLLRSGLNQRILNLSQVAEALRPQVRAHLHKRVSKASILVALSRMQGEQSKTRKFAEQNFNVETLTVHSSLNLITIPLTTDTLDAALDLHRLATSEKRFFTMTEGQRELTVITHKSFAKALLQLSGTESKAAIFQVGAVSVTFTEKYARTPGFFYFILQEIYLQGLNIIDIASTGTELFIFLDEKDVKLGFNTLFYRFGAGRDLPAAD